MKKITLLTMVCMLFGSMTHATNYYTATASTNMEAYGANTIDRVVDGDLNSKFWSGKPQAAGQYVKLDLSETKTIGFIDIYFAEGDQPVAAKLSISENDADWTDLVNFSKSDISNNQYSYNASGRSARYIKMELTGSSNNWFQMCEFRVEEYIAAAPSRTISVSVNDKDMGQAYIDNIGTTSKTAEGPIEITAQANENHEFVNWMLKDGTWVGNTAIYRDNTAGDKEYVALFGATFPTGYCEPSKRINESCTDSNVDDVHSHGIRSLSAKVNGQEVISIGETKTTFNYVQNTQKFSVKPGQQITFEILTGRWANNMWIGCDWNRDGVFEEIHVMYENGIPEDEQQTNENITCTYTLTVPETALTGLSRLRIISDGIVCAAKWLNGYSGYNDPAIMCGTYGDGVIGYAGSVHDLGINVFKANETTALVQPSQHNVIVKGLANGISIETASQTNVSIFSITGLMVCNQTIDKNEFIKVPTGIYAVRAGNQIFKVVVK